MSNPILAETIGFELECEKIYRQRLFNLPKGFNMTGDASIESDSLLIKGIPVVLHGENKALKFSAGVIGTEILSSIINTNKPYLGTLKELCNTLLSLGETEQSKRAGIHVHVSFINNLRILKSALELGANLEDMFFLLGGLGYEFRGIENDSTYCRPITEFGPPIINDNEGDLYPCFILEDVLKSRDMEQFRTRLGDLRQLHGNRYIPVRYMWLNFYNIYSSQCTLEFRNWNKTLNPLAIQLAIEVCKGFAQLAISRAYAKSEPLSVNSIYHKRSKGEIIETFLNFANEIDLASHLMSVAMELLETTPISGLDLPNEYTYSHLRFHANGRKDPIHWTESSYRPSIRVDEHRVRIPKFIDIHNLRSVSQDTLAPYIDRERPRLGSVDLDLPVSVSGNTGRSATVPRSDQTLIIPDWVFNFTLLEVEELD
jgi:hypothetical protein